MVDEIAAGLIVLSVVLALTAIVPPLRSRTFRAVRCLSPFIGIVALVVFVIDWISDWMWIKQEMPSAHELSWVVLVGGFVFFLLFGYRFAHIKESSLFRLVASASDYGVGLAKGRLPRLRQKIMSGVGRICWGRLRAWIKWRGYARGGRETDEH